MEVKIHKAGLLTTVQDLGRTGHRSSGVPVCGPMDTVAFRLANLLVGNNETTAALEITLLGPEIEFSEDRLIAVCGAQLSGIEVNRPHLIKKGQNCASIRSKVSDSAKNRIDNPEKYQYL